MFFILSDQIIPAASKDLLIRIFILMSFFHQMKISWIVFRLALSFFSLFFSQIFWFYSKLFCRRWIFLNFSRLYDFSSLNSSCAPSSFEAFVFIMFFFLLNWPFISLLTGSLSAFIPVLCDLFGFSFFICFWQNRFLFCIIQLLSGSLLVFNVNFLIFLIWRILNFLVFVKIWWGLWLLIRTLS